MKPRAKLVTAEDVGSSLYYCHVNSADDDRIREVLQTGDEVEALQSVKACAQVPPDHSGAVQRHSLPPTPKLELGNRPEPPPKVFPHLQAPENDLSNGPIKRKPVKNINQLPRVQDRSPSPPSLRKLLGPRPMSARHQSVDFAGSDEAPRRETLNLRRWSEQPPALPPRNGVGHHLSEADVSSTSREDFSGGPPPFSSSCRSGFSVTLIRRDPASGGQWNVGRIATEIPEPKHRLVASEKPGNGRDTRVLLEILTSGYDKFQPETNQVQEPAAPQNFSRILNLGPPNPHPQDSSPRRNSFRSSVDRSQRASETQSRPSITSPPPLTKIPRSSQRPYTFASPWNGSCEFSTGLAGRSLKCRHTLDGGAGATPSSSPLPHSARSPRKQRDASSTVSELRFNLPSANVLAPKAAKRPSAVSTSSTGSSSSVARATKMMLRGGGRSSVAYDAGIGDEDGGDGWDGEEDDEERMDLSLGREDAGGGLRGKKAKLGKLIVEREGLLMLDLIIAANMGFWWSLAGEGR